MDTFAQRMLDKAEQRSKALGISSAPKAPLTESNNPQPVKHQHRPTNRTPKKDNSAGSAVARADKRNSPNHKISQRVSDRGLSVETKENTDLSVEINITTGPNVQVQVEVEEREVDEDGNILSSSTRGAKALTATEETNTPVALIRDSSRNRLQRLGALYSESQNLSSPIHRTESRFDDEQIQSRDGASRPRGRFAKLADLANSINSWEDDSLSSDGKDEVQAKKTAKSASSVNAKPSTSKPSNVLTKAKSTEPKIVGMCPRKNEVAASRSVTDGKSAKAGRSNSDALNDLDKAKEKNIKWDPKVMNALESQGFKRRETTTTRLTYDYKNKKDGTDQEKPKVAEAKKASAGVDVKKASSAIASKTEVAPEQKKPVEKKPVEISKGIVLGRTAIFETTSQTDRKTSRFQKDPAEMSLKERLALFEKNKGTALVPKAALGMSVSAKQIAADQKATADVRKPVISIGGGLSSSASASNSAPNSASKIAAYNKPVVADSNAAGTGIRQTVAALLSNTSTISESQISADVRKVREEEMNVLMNRFNKNTNKNTNKPSAIDNRNEMFKPSAPPLTPPPPPPPMPKTSLFSPNGNNDNQYSDSKSKNHKRRSDEKLQDISPQVRDSLEDVKRVKINPPKDGRLYPVLSDIESMATNSDKEQYYSTEEMPKGKNVRFDYNTHQYSSQDEEEDDSYMDSEDNVSYSSNNLNGSFGRDVLSAGRPKKIEYLDSSTASSGNEGVDMDDYLDEALEEDDDSSDYHDNGKPAKKGGSVSSNSFCFEKRPRNYDRQQTIHEEAALHENPSSYRSPVKSQLTATEDDNVVTLTHTVSFYRRQQSQGVNTPVRRVLHTGERDTTTDDNEDSDDIFTNERYIESQKDVVQAKIKSLLDNVAIQQQQISQASNALNTCASTFEFSGSTESVVAEWKLLVATHSRQAALNEVTRLRVERCLRPIDGPKENGRLTVREITIPLKQDYISKLSTDAISGHHLICLLKHNEQVLATKTIPTLPGLLAVKFPDVLQLNNVYADFKATLEIYGMTAQREVLPHDIKYHIKNKKGVIKTPKGKKAESRLIMPPVQSPAGPNAVRSPSFTHYGFVIFSLRETQRTNWTLNQVSSVSPLVGNVYMKVNCELSVTIDYKGFLTMFEDVSGFGAWHRRWCRLHGNVLSYWKYPDDERKPPIGTLDLTTCDQQKITTAPRDVCARLNTLLLELKRPSQPDDRDSLVMVRAGSHTIIRHLLSADTKEERNEWCAHFNKALALMRAWGSSR